MNLPEIDHMMAGKHIHIKSRRRLVGEDKTKAIPKPGLFLTGRLSNSLELIGYLLDNVFFTLKTSIHFVFCFMFKFGNLRGV